MGDPDVTTSAAAGEESGVDGRRALEDFLTWTMDNQATAHFRFVYVVRRDADIGIWMSYTMSLCDLLWRFVGFC